MFLNKLTSLIVLTILTLTLPLSPLKIKKANAADKSLSALRNISPQSTAGSPTQNTPANQPTLSDKTIGALPAVKFNGTAQYLNYNGASLVDKDYTVFVVEQRTSSKANNYFFGGVAAVEAVPLPNEGLILGYKTDTQLVFSQGSNEEIIAIEPYSAGAKPIIHTFVHDSNNGKKYYRNGALVFSDGANTASLVSNNNAQIGRNRTSQYFQGNVAEVAIYKRAISAKEIDSIHGYLLDKWDITVTNDGTACLGTSTPHSPGYVTVTDGVWPDANNGATSTISCTVGGVIGTINNMLCTNGVWSGGGGGGTCGLVPCSDADPDAHVTYGAAALTNSGTWGGATGSIAHNGTVTATCPGGPTGATPTLTCNNGTFNWNSGTCASPGCSNLASNFPATTGYGWVDIVDTTYSNGDRVYAGCDPLTSNGSDGALGAADCDGTDWVALTNKCLPVSIPQAYCPYMVTFGNSHGTSIDIDQNVGDFSRTVSVANGECVQTTTDFGGGWNLCCQSGKWATTAGDKAPFPGIFESTTAPLSSSSSCSNLYCVETNCGSLQAQHPDNASRTYPVTASGSHGDIIYGDCISSGTTPRARCEASGIWNEYVSCP